MSIAENCAIMRQVQADARRRYLARIDRQLAKRTDGLGDLYRVGLDASASNRAERQEHRLSVERDGRYGWRAACACGEWYGRTTASKIVAESDAGRERERIFRPLTAGPVAHSPIPAAVKGAA